MMNKLMDLFPTARTSGELAFTVDGWFIYCSFRGRVMMKKMSGLIAEVTVGTCEDDVEVIAARIRSVVKAA